LTLNQPGLTVRNAQVLDQLGKGQILLPESINVYKGSNTSGTLLRRGTGTLNADGTAGSPWLANEDYRVHIFTRTVASGFSPYHVDYGKTDIRIVFNPASNPSTGLPFYNFNTAHHITYTSRIDDNLVELNRDGNYQVENTVTFTGSNITNSTASKIVRDPWTVISAEVTFTSIPVYVYKIDKLASLGKGLELVAPDTDTPTAPDVVAFDPRVHDPEAFVLESGAVF